MTELFEIPFHRLSTINAIYSKRGAHRIESPIITTDSEHLDVNDFRASRLLISDHFVISRKCGAKIEANK